MKEILERAKELTGQILADRRTLHQCPEVGACLPQTVAYVKKRLDEMGIACREITGAMPEDIRKKFIMAGFPEMKEYTGILAEIGHGSPCILLRGDMDALPIREENDLDFAAVNGSGHMCGHDAHTAMLLGAAAILKERESELPGTVKLMFQPGEEVALGARMMVAEGILENPHVDAAFALHVDAQMDPGQVRYCKNITTASMDTFMIRIKGKGGHSSRPDRCVDSLMIANQVYQGLNLMVSRECDPSAVATFTCGVMNAGTAVNVIPETAEMKAAIRTLNKEARDRMVRRIPEFVEGYVKAWGGSCEIVDFSTPSVWTDETLCQELLGPMKEIAGEEQVQEKEPFSGTEDFAFVAERVPSVFVFMGDGFPENAPLHSSHMVLKEEAFATGAALHANCAYEWLRQKAKGEREK